MTGQELWTERWRPPQVHGLRPDAQGAGLGGRPGLIRVGGQNPYEEDSAPWGGHGDSLPLPRGEGTAVCEAGSASSPDAEPAGPWTEDRHPAEGKTSPPVVSQPPMFYVIL